MGYYIETDAMKDKARYIKENLGAIEVTRDEAEFFVKEMMGAVVCVVDNGPFEAAAFCHNLDKLRCFTLPDDNRPKTWLFIDDRERVEQITGYSR